MLRYIFILSLFISSSVFGQDLYYTYRGSWINEKQQAIVITDNNKMNANSMLSNHKYDYPYLRFWYQADTIYFNHEYYTGTGEINDLYTFKVKSVSDSFLTVQPLSDLAQKYFSTTSPIRFIRQDYAVDTSVKFEKLIYNLSSDCFPGPCSGIYLEINNNKQVYLDLLTYRDLDIVKTRTGSFKSSLNDSLYNVLNHLIQTCSLASLTFPEKDADDYQVVDLIIYYNGKVKHLSSMVPPVIAHPLLNFLKS